MALRAGTAGGVVLTYSGRTDLGSTFGLLFTGGVSGAGWDGEVGWSLTLLKLWNSAVGTGCTVGLSGRRFFSDLSVAF